MLSELNIRDFAIIDELQVRFTEGLTVISGETGAGKSILIGAVGLLLGERASADMIRSLKDEAVVEALFDIRGQKDLQAKICEMGFGEADEIIIRRVVSRSGKNRVYINGHIGALSSLAAIGEALINICGQNAHQMILHPDNQIDILDEFGALLPLRGEYRKIYDHYCLLGTRLRLLAEKQGKRTEREELLRDGWPEMTSEERTRFLDILDAEVRRMDRLVRRLIELARVDLAEPGDAVTDLAQLRKIAPLADDNDFRAGNLCKLEQV